MTIYSLHAPSAFTSTGGVRYTTGKGAVASPTASPLLPFNWTQVIKVSPGEQLSAVSNDGVAGIGGAYKLMQRLEVNESAEWMFNSVEQWMRACQAHSFARTLKDFSETYNRAWLGLPLRLKAWLAAHPRIGLALRRLGLSDNSPAA